MERDPYEGGTDVGRDIARDLGDDPPGALRDAPPDILSPIDESAPVSGHVPPPEKAGSPMDSPEHDWALARELVRPAFRPIGTQGMSMETVDRETLAQQTMQTHHSQPLLDMGPAGLPIVYTMAAGGFDIVINGDHLLSWGIEPSQLQDAAIRNLATWAANAPWSEETSGDRRVISSDTGEGLDAVRILLPDAVTYLERELSGEGRVLVGIPERHLLLAATLRPDDSTFAALFGEFVLEQSGDADEPIDRRLFEIVDGRLVEFVA
jgi:hypothetical protein